MTKPNSRQPLMEDKEKIMKLFLVTQKSIKEYMVIKSNQHGFTYPQMRLILAIYKNQGTNLHELSEDCEMTKSTVSGIVDRLVAQQVVIREIPEEDRRTVKLYLSPDFLREFHISKFKKQLLNGFIKDAPKEDLDTIINGFEKLLQLINKD